jgi:hypothetical protein
LLHDLQGYNFTIEWISGKEQTISDCLSRQVKFSRKGEERTCPEEAMEINYCR